MFFLEILDKEDYTKNTKIAKFLFEVVTVCVRFFSDMDVLEIKMKVCYARGRNEVVYSSSSSSVYHTLITFSFILQYTVCTNQSSSSFFG